MHRVRRFFIVLSVFLVVLGVATFAVLVTRRPVWYRPPDPMDMRVMALADRVEYRIIEEAQRIRPDEGAWTVRIRSEQVNAWLASRLPKWVANRYEQGWPDALGTPQVRLAEASIDLATEVQLHGRAQVIVLTVAPWLDDDGGMRLRLDGIQLGRIPLGGDPISRLTELLDGVVDIDDRMRSWIAVLTGETAIDPIIRLADDRRVRITDLRVDHDLADVTCRTLDG